METESIKSLANKVLQRNSQGNKKETGSFHAGNFQETETKDKETLTVTFDRLFREHMAFLRGHSTTLDEIKKHNPIVAGELIELSRELDKAWLRQDLNRFQTVIEQIEKVYVNAHRQVTGDAI